MNGLDAAQISRLQTLLARRRDALLRQLEDDVASAGLGADAASEIEASPADNASLRTLNQLVSEAGELKAAQLRTVKHALAKFADGSYGLCEYCGEHIGISRLDARPEARLCIACQTRMEKAGRPGP
ncbi:TraR/DksA family transcriptional regulator [Janthinobacterium fluminis]|uniref:TraR/DksA family transcriptional regulator n=1 Tax=Janthinobacterium fluminis TaxID=2987524 RepID=A0ABT5K539_9BURK|nr:TraR/DksA family transcriptional regulator [Janthinobacterium fluminis]MDC8760098.1 TraR/DksA family transcriptional regulator [Janthinobacterium fluminis]